METTLTVLLSIPAAVIIALGVAAQVGAGGTIISKIDKLVEQRLAPRAIIMDENPGRKQKRL
ncbi:hypothetical protein [Azospirillum brasilense]|uniref:hypothetical protein n=1 Tax=Azospirillum brasilense TaxID=192 RepID=UPI001EDAEDBC|nr:hypothetical protein [Azospirillum brasilense]UKJ74465.1 hypothetical protein H1Q64_18050 [Azospirillum brasilense]